MDFFIENVKDTLEAINKLVENNIFSVNTKRIRNCLHVKSQNRSKINFIWRALKYLAKNDKLNILEKNGIHNPATYIIKITKKMDVENILSIIKKEVFNRGSE